MVKFKAIKSQINCHNQVNFLRKISLIFSCFLMYYKQTFCSSMSSSNFRNIFNHVFQSNWISFKNMLHFFLIILLMYFWWQAWHNLFLLTWHKLISTILFWKATWKPTYCMFKICCVLSNSVPNLEVLLSCIFPAFLFKWSFIFS